MKANSYGRRLARMTRADRLLARALHRVFVHRPPLQESNKAFEKHGRLVYMVAVNPRLGGGHLDEQAHDRAVQTAGMRTA